FDEEGQLQDDNEFGKHFTFRIGGNNAATRRSFVSNADENYMLDDFEWFYFPPTDRWGLRKYDGTIQIEPTFDYIQIERDLGFTLVGIDKLERANFDRTSYRFEMVYGLVKNEVGLLVTEVDFLDVRLGECDSGLPAARGVFSNGRQGLVSNIGKILRKDYAFIGEFENGLARMSVRGKLSGAFDPDHPLELVQTYLSRFLSTNYLTDYTQHDRDFERTAQLVCDDCEWGYIDTAGQIAVQPNYTFARDFTNEVGIVECKGKKGMINLSGETLIPCDYDGIDFLENTDNQIVKVFVEQPKYGLIDTLGQLTVSATYDEVGSFSEGRLAVRRNNLWGFVDANGLEVIPCRFRQVNNFSESKASVKLGRKWGFIDKQGELEIAAEYNRAGNFHNGLAWIYTGGDYGYLNQTGEFVIPAELDKAFDFNNGIARVAVDGEYGLIDTTGSYILRPKYSNIDPFDENGLAIVRYGNNRIQYGIIDQNGRQLNDKNYRSVKPFKEGFSAVKYKDDYGFINTFGKLVIPAEYSKVADFQEDRVAVQQNGQCGYLRPDGSIVVDLKYSKCLDFKDGKAVVYKGSRKAGLVDAEGNELIEPSLNKLINFSENRGLVRDEKYRFYYITDQARIYDGFYQKATPFQHGVAVVQMDGKWGIINQKGIEIIPPKYDRIESFENGYARVRIRGFNGLTNLKGELIVEPDYEYISYAGEGLFRVEQGDKIGYFNSVGEWVYELAE
ncbi:MAG: WG repeat-containing protein, partial [Saprospiraceae bacterium]